MGRKSANPKREIKASVTKEEISSLCKKVKYVGSPNHKTKPCQDYNFSPLACHSEGSLCDEEGIIRLKDAQSFLQQGIKQGLVSARCKDGFPCNIWCVDDKGRVWEAQGNKDGEYHGYLLADDAFKDTVLKKTGRK